MNGSLSSLFPFHSSISSYHPCFEKERESHRERKERTIFSYISFPIRLGFVHRIEKRIVLKKEQFSTRRNRKRTSVFLLLYSSVFFWSSNRDGEREWNEWKIPVTKSWLFTIFVVFLFNFFSTWNPSFPHFVCLLSVSFSLSSLPLILFCSLTMEWSQERTGKKKKELLLRLSNGQSFQ